MATAVTDNRRFEDKGPHPHHAASFSPVIPLIPVYLNIPLLPPLLPLSPSVSFSGSPPVPFPSISPHYLTPSPFPSLCLSLALPPLPPLFSFSSAHPPSCSSFLLCLLQQKSQHRHQRVRVCTCVCCRGRCTSEPRTIVSGERGEM